MLYSVNMLWEAYSFLKKNKGRDDIEERESRGKWVEWRKREKLIKNVIFGIYNRVILGWS